jgi:hypothetical protein
MLSKLRESIRAAFLAAYSRGKILLLAAFPFADQLMIALASNLPALAPYLPGNVYKWVGFTVVAFGVLRDLYRKYQETREILNG